MPSPFENGGRMGAPNKEAVVRINQFLLALRFRFRQRTLLGCIIERGQFLLLAVG